MSAYGYDPDPDRYSAGEWEHSKQEALAERAAKPPPQRTNIERTPITLGPGILNMSLRGDPADIERFVAAVKRAGFELWHTDSRGTRSGNDAGFRYFSVQVPRDG